MVLMLPEDPDKTVQADWFPFKAGEVMYADGIKTVLFGEFYVLLFRILYE